MELVCLLRPCGRVSLLRQRNSYRRQGLGSRPSTQQLALRGCKIRVKDIKGEAIATMWMFSRTSDSAPPSGKGRGDCCPGRPNNQAPVGGSPIWILIQQTTHKQGVLISGQFEYGLDTDWMIKELLILCLLTSTMVMFFEKHQHLLEMVGNTY